MTVARSRRASTPTWLLTPTTAFKAMKDVRVEVTMVGGQIIYDRDQS